MPVQAPFPKLPWASPACLLRQHSSWSWRQHFGTLSLPGLRITTATFGTLADLSLFGLLMREHLGLAC